MSAAATPEMDDAAFEATVNELLDTIEGQLGEPGRLLAVSLANMLQNFMNVSSMGVLFVVHSAAESEEDDAVLEGTRAIKVIADARDRFLEDALFAMHAIPGHTEGTHAVLGSAFERIINTFVDKTLSIARRGHDD